MNTLLQPPKTITRRQFAKASLLAAGAVAGIPGLLEAEANPLPTVRWGRYELSRLMLGHNPIKGVSHTSAVLDEEMKTYFAEDPSHGLELMRACEGSGINAIQMGFRPTETSIEQMIRQRKAQGGRFHWLATFYSLPQDREAAKAELRHLLEMDPRPIAVHQVGNTTDLLAQQGKLELSLENLKRFRDAGLLVGLCSHNHEVIQEVESKGWDLDFYQCCFYRSLFALDARARGRERFEAADREAMTRVIRQVSKPCIAYKVLGAGRHCQSRATVEAALRYAFGHIKPQDVVLLGMWQKHKDQVLENAALTRKILALA